MALPQSMDPELRRRIEAAADRSETSVDEWLERAARRELNREHGEMSPADTEMEQSSGALSQNPRESVRSLLAAIVADREGLYLPPPGSKPEGSAHPIKLKGGKTMAETIIEERGER